MRRALIPHPAEAAPPGLRIEVEAARPGPGELAVHYVVTGAIGDLLLPCPAAPARTDGLWRHSCFEAFVRAPPAEAYCELNFAPSLQWAAYGFSAYRDGMGEARMEPPRVEVRSNGDRYELRASIALDGVAALPGDAAWRLGLSAVIEERNGRKSWWALAHPPGPPDFHHEDCFALELPAARPA
jgi:hypothetical protein